MNSLGVQDALMLAVSIASIVTVIYILVPVFIGALVFSGPSVEAEESFDCEQIGRARPTFAGSYELHSCRIPGRVEPLLCVYYEGTGVGDGSLSCDW